MKILLFVLLKIVEISGVVFGPYYLGKFVHLWTGFFCYHDWDVPKCVPFWAIGAGSMTLAFLALVALVVIYVLIRSNWQLADKLYLKLKK